MSWPPTSCEEFAGHGEEGNGDEDDGPPSSDMGFMPDMSGVEEEGVQHSEFLDGNSQGN